MPLPPPESARSHIHTRSVRFEGFRREDGRYDIECRLMDIKPIDCHLGSGRRLANEPIHEMWIRLTVDEQLNITAVSTASDANPYGVSCQGAAADYNRVVGLNLGRGFRRKVQEVFGGVRGCTHLTELLGQFPTAAIQTLAGRKRDTDAVQSKPHQLDRCHALDTRGEAVREFYPRWYQGAKTGTDSD